MLGIFYLICKYIKNKFIRIFVLFTISSIAIGTLEYLGGFLIEALFGRIFWDYSDEMFNIGKYTSLKMMIIWGLASVLVIYLINPFVNLIIKKIPKSITLTLAFLFIFDLIYTLISLS